jgi:hypothetical protein
MGGIALGALAELARAHAPDDRHAAALAQVLVRGARLVGERAHGDEVGVLAPLPALRVARAVVACEVQLAHDLAACEPLRAGSRVSVPLRVTFDTMFGITARSA